MEKSKKAKVSEEDTTHVKVFDVESLGEWPQVYVRRGSPK